MIINKTHSLAVFSLIVVLLFSCKSKPIYNYHIKGVVVKATTQEPLEGVIIEVKKEVGSGGSIFNPEFKITELHQATTNDKGEFEMAFTSENVTLKIKFIKEYMRIFYSGLEGPYINSGTNTLNEVSMYAQTEEFAIEFEPTLPNVKEVTLELEWNGFSGGSAENVIWGIFSSRFTIENYIIEDVGNNTTGDNIRSINIGEQWLKMNFDILLEDNSRLQKTDSIWLPGRYYDINEYDFGDPRKYPVYKFRY